MKRINFDDLNERNEFSLSNFLRSVNNMEFIKHGDKYLIKGSNGIIVDEKEKLKLENEEMIIQDFQSNNCQQETTKKIAKNKKKINALQNKESADDIIKKTSRTV